MKYPLENLSPELFQEFAQSLLLREFPDITCFPIGQPDGGRDALRYIESKQVNSKRTTWIFQIKYTRDPNIQDLEEWLDGVIKLEIKKINELISRGCEKYILITNAIASSHLDVGKMDKVQKFIESKVSIPVSVIWRHEIERRLDNAWDLKWAYPTLMQGSDLLRLVFESAFADTWERRHDAITAFLNDQYSRDIDVRFKQIDLKSNLFDLYVDVPVLPSFNHDDGTTRFRLERVAMAYHALCEKKAAKSNAPTRYPYWNDNNINGGYVDQPAPIDAAEFLFSIIGQQLAPAIVLEGAPGQGKSTITQYLCQQHRARFLGRPNSLTGEIPFRLPIKIDLRDYAVWLSRKNPFDKKNEEIPLGWERSTESFISALIKFHSGGFSFAVEDLSAIAKRSALLLVFDGLDEVADISLREQIVAEISRGYTRLKQNSASIQVIVTSRPAAFVNAPVLPKEHFEKLVLAPLSSSHIDSYVRKWEQAKGLSLHDIQLLNDIIERRLGEPHLRELARNPMQLAILLNLMHTRGVSLPDKRTALYDSYIDLFFDRESEKSDVVRDHRDLLINIHRHLAWKIHVASEFGDATGRVSDTEMLSWIRSYLDEEGYPSSILDQLFIGMVERVVAIVSRVEGTYEFVVQPVREYFTARYLYETAPYSPPGREQSGTKSDRFYAVARNFYWFNVARFFAGCFSKGELLALIEKLEELADDADYKLTSHPRLLSFTLLSDWVFAQHPKSVGRVVDIITSEESLSLLLLNAVSGRIRGESLELPERCGRAALVEHAMTLLGKKPAKSFALELINIIRTNSDSHQLKSAWLSLSIRQHSRNEWLEYGFRLGLLGALNEDEIRPLFHGAPSDPTSCIQLISAKQFKTAQWLAGSDQKLVEYILDRATGSRGYSRITSAFELLCMFTDPGIFNYIHLNHPAGFLGLHPMREISDHWPEIKTQTLVDGLEINARIVEFVETMIDESKKGALRWRTTLEPWVELANRTRALAIGSWFELVIANQAAAIKSKKELGAIGDALFDRRVEICSRYRFARLKAGLPSWWRESFSSIKTTQDQIEYSLLFFSWASVNVINALHDEISPMIEALSPDNFSRVFEIVKSKCHGDSKRSEIDIQIRDLIVHKNTPQRLVLLLSCRLNYDETAGLFKKIQFHWADFGPSICQHIFNVTISLLRHECDDRLTEQIASAYGAGALDQFSNRNRSELSNSVGHITAQHSRKILSQPNRYPLTLVMIAEQKIRREIATQLKPIGNVSDKEKWFTTTEFGYSGSKKIAKKSRT